MKRTILLTAVSLLTVAALGQGSVVFQNAATVPGWLIPRDRNVKFDATAATYNPLLVPGANVSSNYAGVDLSTLRATLLYAPGIVPDENWWTVTNLAMPTISGTSPYATFKQSTSTTAGSWFGGIRTMDGIPASNGVVSLMVFVWDAAHSPEPISWAAFDGLFGRSAVFQYITYGWDAPLPTEPLPDNLQGFNLGIFGQPFNLPADAWGGVPEPSAAALTGLGVTLLFLLRWGKKPEPL